MKGHTEVCSPEQHWQHHSVPSPLYFSASELYLYKVDFSILPLQLVAKDRIPK